MSGKVCAFHKCTNSKRKNPDLVFFSFPRSFNLKSDNRIATWAKNAGLSKSLPPDFYRSQLVCQIHFENWCFTNILRKRLVHNAVPTISTDDVKTKTNNSNKDAKESLVEEITLIENKNDENKDIFQSNAKDRNKIYTDFQINKPIEVIPKSPEHKLHIKAVSNVCIDNQFNFTCDHNNKPKNHKTYSRVKSFNCENLNVAKTFKNNIINEIEEQTDKKDTCHARDKSVGFAISTEARGIDVLLSTGALNSDTYTKHIEVDRSLTINNVVPNSKSELYPTSQTSFESRPKTKLKSQDALKLKKIVLEKNDSAEYSDLCCFKSNTAINKDCSKSNNNINLLQKNLSDHEHKINDLKRKLNFYRKQSMVKSNIINMLRIKNSVLKSTKTNICKSINKTKVSNVCKTLAKMQLKHKQSWNSAEQNLSLKLYSKFPVTVKYMRDVLGLRFPNDEILCSWIENKSVVTYR